MDSERRHELATNELADWIANFPQWLKENKTTVIVGTVVVLGLIAYTIFFYNIQGKTVVERDAQASMALEQLALQKMTVLQGKSEGLNVSDMFLNTAGSLANAALESKNKNFSALAMIKRAEALRSELHYRSKIAAGDTQATQIGQAKKLYEDAMAAADMPMIKAMAQYGIGLCLEETGDFDGAKSAYQTIADANEYQGTPFSQAAKQRMANLEDYKNGFSFAAAPPKKLSLEAPLTDTNAVPGADIGFNPAVK